MQYTSSLCELYINQSFNRLLQISGSDNVILNGTGSIVDILTVSGNLITTNNFFAGDDITNNHYFTGSVNISGSLTINNVTTDDYAKRIMYMSIGI